MIEQLEHLFGAEKYPGNVALADSWPNEWESTFSQLREKDWRTVRAKDFDSQGGVMEGIQALSCVGFIYFLPGLARIVLSESESRYTIVSALLSRFAHTDGAGNSIQKQQEILARLSIEQRDFLARFFAEMQRLDPHFSPGLIEPARKNLMGGAITKHHDTDDN